MQAPFFELANLNLHYGRRSVLNDLSFKLAPAQAIGLLGPNGSGKSSAIAALVGTVSANATGFIWKGQRMPLASTMFRRHIGVVLQNTSTDPKLSARQNLRLAAMLYGLDGPTARERIQLWLDFVELTPRADEPLLQLSGGMRRRVELIRALLHEPELLILDEPTTGLDEPMFHKTWDKLQELQKTRGLAIVLSTHRPEEAELCDRILILNEGHVIAQGNPDELRTLVRGDVIELEAKDLDGLAEVLTASMNLTTQRVGDKLVIEHPEAHRLIPRIIEHLPQGRLESVSLHRPTLADVFVRLTGHHFRQSKERAA
ncbi:MAG: ABC transporter ATP-binding protein [Myxococcales bacterium]|nr:ABC transporter ATP-binding protein [Myxococcales bacterium]MCB9708897.1 ABC transporter ATP-binding protein [Myxococcales bacterium]